MPFEIVLIGGDDLMIFTTASLAPMLSVKILQRFENESKAILEEAGVLAHDFYERLKKGYEPDHPPIANNNPILRNKKLTMAAGIVLCHSNFPVPVLVEIGETLQKNAKKKCSEEGIQYREGAIDFQVITGGAYDLESGRVVLPHNRPYRVTDMETLIDYVEKFKKVNFPRTQLQMIYDACHYQSRARATLATLHTISRLNKPQQRRELKDFLTRFPTPGASYIQWPWTFIPGDSQTLNLNGSASGRKGLKSAFVDLVDLYDFVKTEKDSVNANTEED